MALGSEAGFDSIDTILNPGFGIKPAPPELSLQFHMDQRNTGIN